MGAEHVNNYDHDSSYGGTARSLTPNRLSVHHIIEISEPKTLSQSFKAITMHDVARVVGLFGGIEEPPQPCITKGIDPG